MTDCFLVRVSEQVAARVPFPADLPLADRDTYMANPPAAAIAAAEHFPLPSDPVPPDAAPPVAAPPSSPRTRATED